MVSLSLSSSPTPYQLRSQKRSCLQAGRCLFHSPLLEPIYIHSSISLQNRLMRSLGSIWQACWTYLRASVGSIRCAQAKERLRAGRWCGLLICEYVSAAVAQWPSWQERMPLLVRTSLRSGQQVSSRRLEQMVMSISASDLNWGSSGRRGFSFYSQSSEMRMKKSNKFSSYIQRTVYLEDSNFWSFLYAAVKRSKVAAECWVEQSAHMIMQSVQQSSLVCAASEESFLTLWMILQKQAFASSQLPFSKRQYPMLQDSEQLSGSISMPFWYSSRAFCLFPTSSNRSPNSLWSLADALLRLFLILWETYSQCLMDCSQFYCRLRTLPMALWAYRLSFSKGSSASLLLKQMLQALMALPTLSESTSAIFSSKIRWRVRFKSPSGSSEIVLSANSKFPLSIKAIPDASVRNSLPSLLFSAMFSCEKDSKMLSILLFSFFLDCVALRVMPSTESSQNLALSSNFLSRFKQRPISWLISSFMSHLGLFKSSFSFPMASSILLRFGFRMVDTLARQNCAIMLSGSFRRMFWNSPSASVARQ